VAVIGVIVDGGGSVVGGRQGASGFNAGRLRAARLSAHLTQGALAEAAGAHVKEVREWESGRRVPQVDALAGLARALHIDPIDLTDIDEGQALTLGQLRTLAGLSQQQVADASGLLRTTYSQIERGETASVSDNDAAGIARALDRSSGDIAAAHAAARAAHVQRRPTTARRGRPAAPEDD
jgi:transcriptional regulator with XRE-family HTH domain